MTGSEQEEREGDRGEVKTSSKTSHLRLRAVSDTCVLTVVLVHSAQSEGLGTGGLE